MPACTSCVRSTHQPDCLIPARTPLVRSLTNRHTTTTATQNKNLWRLTQIGLPGSALSHSQTQPNHKLTPHLLKAPHAISIPVRSRCCHCHSSGAATCPQTHKRGVLWQHTAGRPLLIHRCLSDFTSPRWCPPQAQQQPAPWQIQGSAGAEAHSARPPLLPHCLLTRCALAGRRQWVLLSAPCCCC